VDKADNDLGVGGLGHTVRHAGTKKLQAYPSEKSEKQVHEV
jgi:hypothetical protein